MRRITTLLILTLLALTATAGERDEAIDTWVNASLYGNDNDMAALRKVSIRQTGEGYRVNIRNQFNFECSLTFDDAGNPEALADCRSLDEPSPICNPEMPDADCAIKSGCFRQPDEQRPECFESWIVQEPRIPLSCRAGKLEIVCTGRYTLGTTRGFATDGRFTIARKRR